MIRIDHLSFGFTAPDETFAHGLYAEWDDFCRNCFEQVVEESLAAYDKERVLHEIGRLELDLGVIPEEEFYREFPLRLKEALLKALPPLGMHTADEAEKSAASRRDNLLFFLKYGFARPEWADGDFNPAKEAGWLLSQSVALYASFVTRTAQLCLKQEYVLHRLLWQTDNGETHLRVYAAALAEPSAGLQEKHRFLTLMLEERPDIPVRFVHRAGSDGELQGMAALLDSPTVRCLMRTETREHAEVDLPPYWHYLYEWLIRYYPFNGLSVFGGKAEFIRHLHHRLLTFIRKRNDTPYLSKMELTLDFLLEVFGPVHYKEVLNAIYGLQPRRADGSPEYDGYFNRELYRIFMQLSLLELPGDMAEETNGEKTETLKTSAGVKEITAILKGNTQNDADKRTLLVMMAEQQPERLPEWLRKEASKDETLLSSLSDLTDDRTLNRLLAVFSLVALETVILLREYLERHNTEIIWLREISEFQRQSAIRKAVLQWMADGNTNRSDAIITLLCLIYREVTGGRDSDAAVEPLAGILRDIERKHEPVDRGIPKTESVSWLQSILSDTTLPEAVRQRAVVAFWETYREDYAKAIVLLQTQHLLTEVIRLTGNAIKEEIIRHQTVQTFGAERVTVLLPLFTWLVEHETELPRLQETVDGPFEAGLFYRLAVQTQRRNMRAADAIRELFTTLWGENRLPAILKKISESITSREDTYTREALLALLEVPESNGKAILLSAFHEWNHRQEMFSNTVQTVFEEHWNATDGLARWLEDNSMPTDYKCELLQTAITEHTQEWMALLRNTAQTEKTLETLTGYLSVPVLRQGIAKVNFYQASVLARVAERIELHADAFPFLAANGVSLSSALSKALLRYMQDADTLERTLTEKEIVEKFLSFLYIIYKGETGSDYRNDTGWKQLAAIVMPEAEQQGIVELTKQNISKTLSDKILSATKLQDTIQFFAERQPDKLLSWLEEDAGIEEIRRIAEVTNIVIWERWVEYLSTVAGFVNAAAFRRLAIWLLHSSSVRYSAVELATALFTWMKEADWKRQTLRQMEDYFFARLHGGSARDVPLPMESLAQTDLPETTRQRLLQHYLRLRPKDLLAYIRRSVAEHSIPLERWAEWLDAGEWLSLAASLSLSATELLRQVAEVLHLDEQTHRKVWGICLTTGNKEEEWAYNSPEENIRSFVQIVTSVQGQGEGEMETIVRRIKEELHLPEESVPVVDDVPEFFPVANAGLCLLAPWLVRLFGMLGYLDEEKKKLKDTASKIRAVFLLQYLVYGEEREYRETELSFNRLLTGLSRHIPLPKHLPLLENERQTADSMVAGVKANWPQLEGTSVRGFRQSFIARSGTLEWQEERWLLTVEKRTHDILLDSVPWSFRQIRLPWLKKHIQVVWNEKQEFI